jgi:hypothetical protein
MAFAAMTPLATITLTSAASAVTFSNIPATFKDIRIISNVTSLSASPTAQGSNLRFNGDSGSNYSTNYGYSNGSSLGAGIDNTTSASWGQFPSTGGIDHLDILDYASTTKQKVTLGRADGNGASTWMYCSKWASNSAITSITLNSPDFGGKTFGIGSTFSIYGIAG